MRKHEPGRPCDCRECRTPINCGCCTFADRPEEWILDLGAGGWTDNECAECDEIQGEYTLLVHPMPGACTWLYTVPNYCGTKWLCMSLAACVAGGKYRAYVAISDICDPPVKPYSRHIWESEVIGDDCLSLLDEVTGKMALNNILWPVGSVHVGLGGEGPPCLGGLPVPIYAWPAP